MQDTKGKSTKMTDRYIDVNSTEFKARSRFSKLGSKFNGLGTKLSRVASNVTSHVKPLVKESYDVSKQKLQNVRAGYHTRNGQNIREGLGDALIYTAGVGQTLFTPTKLGKPAKHKKRFF